MLISRRKSWFGFFLGKSRHSGVDTIYCEISNSNSVEVVDAYSTRTSTPNTDNQNDITLEGQEITDQYVKVKFSRLLNTGDSKDFKINYGKEIDFAAAFTPRCLSICDHEGHYITG